MVWTLVIAFLLGVPSVILTTGLFSRMTPIYWWQYALWATSAVLSGLVLAARRVPGGDTCKVEGRTLTGNGLAYIAFACPICNKFIVLALGAQGALSYFAPLQPFLGIVSIALLVTALRRSLRRPPGVTRFYPDASLGTATVPRASN